MFFLDVVCSFDWTDVVAIKNDFALEFVPVLFDVVVLNHNDNHINFIEELVEVKNLVLYDFFVCEEWIITLKRASAVALLNIKHLEGWAFTHVIYVFLVSDTIKAYSAVISNAVFLHYLVDALQNKDRLAIVGLHRFVYDLCQLRIIANKEPRIYADAMSTYSRAWLKDIYTRMHIADLDDFINIHVVVAANS